MGGLEKITEHIINNAKKTADEIINEAKKKADEIKRLSDDENKRLTFENNEKIKAECEKIKQMAESADRQSERQAMLDIRNGVIKTIINESEKKIISMDKTEYLDFLKTILKNSQTGEKGEILFSAADKKLIDNDFIAECKKISGDALEVSEETAPVDKGFIIRYGKTEQNCSIKGIIEDKYNELTDLVNSCISKE